MTMTTKRVTQCCISLLELIICAQGFIVDIDDIQAHGMYGLWIDVSLVSPKLTDNRRWCSRYYETQG